MIRSAPFFRAYHAVPHFLVNGVARAAARATRPSFLVDAAVRAWIRREGIDMRDFASGPFESVEDFFLRRLRPGARPLGAGFVSPVDGCVVGEGIIERGTILQVKGHPISVERLVNGNGLHRIALDRYDGGRWVTLFLRPRGYHFVHAPADLIVEDVHWIPGRFFPQNEDALRHVPRIYERNERAVLRCSNVGGEIGEALLVMVGASVVGGIRVRGVEVEELRRRESVSLARRVAKGEELGHFTFGSTVVVLLPRAAGTTPPLAKLAEEVPMGRTLFEMLS